MNVNEVHVYIINIQFFLTQLVQFRAMLDEVELQRVAGISHIESSAHFILGHGILKLILSRLIDSPPQSIKLTNDKYGRPYLRHGGESRVDFNIAHSEDYILIAIAKELRVGIDVERIRKVSEMKLIAEKFFSEENIDRLNEKSSDSERLLFFFQAWARLEAEKKAIGTGLSGDLLLDNLTDLSKISVENFQLANDYSAALAILGKSRRTLFFDLIPDWKIPILEFRERSRT